MGNSTDHDNFLKVIENLRNEVIEYSALKNARSEVIMAKTANISMLIAFYRSTALYISEIELDNFKAHKLLIEKVDSNIQMLNEVKRMHKIFDSIKNTTTIFNSLFK